jgi:hypothetical protein
MHAQSYLAYAAWLAPLLMPAILAIVWRAQLSHKLSFVVLGVLTGLGVLTLSMLPLSLLLVWMNKALGVDARDQWENRVWLNSILTMAFNVAVTYIAMIFLANALGKRGGKGSSNAG